MESAPDIHRRRLLQASLGTATLFLPVPYAWVGAQTEGTLKLLRAPKFALVIGNRNYKRAPLKNPANDARAIADTLKNTGFDVTVRLDAVQSELAEAVQTYAQLLAQRKGVGLFYFAGHGLQLAWRNYMIPVDADIRSAADIQTQGVEVGALLSGISRAANPLNVIILDACRDNPFGNLSGVDQKGLSQVDAPPSTLLAYATAPGNVASDGEGTNGLYTEHLLKEITVPEARVEDVFKRVRLQVRRRTNGQQIPWESTSLEEDFWFVPPKELKKVSDAEATSEFEAELAIWQRIKEANAPAPIEEYLRRYPSGRFSELAQLRLEQVLSRAGEKRIAVVSDAKNPYSKGSVVWDSDFKVGDSYTFRTMDRFSRAVEETYTETVARITDTEVIFDGKLITDRMGNRLTARDGRRFTSSQGIPLEFAVGKRWPSRFHAFLPNGNVAVVNLDIRIVGRETVTVPAGTFDAFVIESSGWSRGGGPVDARATFKSWYAPSVTRGPLVFEAVRLAGNNYLENSRTELVSFKQA